jgi:hypothetical protein
MRASIDRDCLGVGPLIIHYGGSVWTANQGGGTTSEYSTTTLTIRGGIRSDAIAIIEAEESLSMVIRASASAQVVE